MSATESDVLQAVLVLNAMGEGRGPQAFGLYQRALSAEVRPALLEEQEALRQYEEAADALTVVIGRDAALADPEIADLAARADEATKKAKARCDAVWTRLLAEMRTPMEDAA